MKQTHITLFWKFSLSIILIVILFGSINGYLIWNNIYAALREESRYRGLDIGKNIAAQSVDFILYEDYISLQNMISRAIQIDSTIAYIFISTPQNKVLVKSFEHGVSQDLVQANTIPPGAEQSIISIYPVDNPKEIIQDIAIPIMGGNLGVVRVGLYEQRVHNHVEKTILIFWLLAAIFLIVGIIGAFSFAHFINRPIRQIIAVANQMDFDALRERSLPRIKIRQKLWSRWKLLIRAEDEIDHLAATFNKMINRLENAYNSLQKTQDRLIQSEKMAIVGTVAAGLAHEINNPLAGLQSCLRRLKKNPADLQQVQKYHSLMDEAVQRIEKVVRRMLNFSRKHEFNFEPLNIDLVIEQSLMLLAFQLEESRVTIQKKYAVKLPPIHGSSNHLEQVFVNLILNSLDALAANPASGPENVRRISFMVERIDNQQLKIRYQDSGPGIKNNDLKKIFEPFYTTKKIGRGTGLGLAVCYNIIQAHNGTITAIDTNGNGACFEICLPIYPNKG